MRQKKNLRSLSGLINNRICLFHAQVLKKHFIFANYSSSVLISFVVTMLTIKIMSFYTRGQCESGRGSNEIFSALFNFLKSKEHNILVARRKCAKLNLYADSCPGQNKNQTLLLALLINSENSIFKTITITFPVRGHSCMESVQVNGRVKETRCRETILLPKGYYDIFENHGTTRTMLSDWRVYDYQGLIKRSLKSNVFPLRVTKRWLLERKSMKIWTYDYYKGDFQSYEILRPNNFSSQPETEIIAHQIACERD